MSEPQTPPSVKTSIAEDPKKMAALRKAVLAVAAFVAMVVAARTTLTEEQTLKFLESFVEIILGKDDAHVEDNGLNVIEPEPEVIEIPVIEGISPEAAEESLLLESLPR